MFNTDIRTLLFSTKSKFKIGDSVQLIEGGHLMRVMEVLKSGKMKEPLINCIWFEPATKETRTNMFPERKLKPFDWTQK